MSQDHRQRISRRHITDEEMSIFRSGFFIGVVGWNRDSRCFDAMSWKDKTFKPGFRTIENAIQWIREQ